MHLKCFGLTWGYDAEIFQLVFYLTQEKLSINQTSRLNNYLLTLITNNLLR